ncbi:MAG: 3-deoxy-D-manno-octulosonic acid transferase, partial [Marinovum sp.]|nr:3-deoxy-D-manno-octulosonic acid transferase [Marinovum sp.]
GQISAPDVAAQMAFAAWQVTSDGAELTDAVIDRVLSHLDEIGV